MIVAVDTMGGDNAPKAQIDAAIEAVKEYDVEVVLLGDENDIKKYLEGKAYDFNKISIVHCSENIDNDEKPVMSIKKKKDSAAGNWAVKEAVAKAMGTGFFGMKIKEIEVLRDELGKPYVKLYGKALEKQKELGIERFFVSISDTKEYTSAVAVAEG